MRLLFATLLASWLVGHSFSVTAQTTGTLAITNVTVLPLNNSTALLRQTVLIKNGFIQKIGSTRQLQVPKGAFLVDGTGKYLLPGLIDMHAHLPGKEGTRHPLTSYFQLNLASGITGLRSMRGDSSHLRWRDSLRRTNAPAPHLYLGTPVFTRDKNYSARKGQLLLRRYKNQGYNFAKYLGGMTAPQFDSLLMDAHQLGFPVAGHAPRSGLRSAVAARMASIEHIDAFIEAYQQDSVQFRQLAQQMAANHIFTCPDLYWYQIAWLQYPLEHLQQLPGLGYVTPQIRNEWMGWWEAKSQQLKPQGVANSAHAQLTASLRTYHRAFRILHEAGVQFLVSPSDGPFVVPGFGMAEELGLLVGQGLSPLEALRAATVNAATWLGEQHQRGTLETGKAADLLLLDANPLEDIANVRRVSGVIVDGHWSAITQLLPAKP